jgi:hypothetical protein
MPDVRSPSVFLHARDRFAQPTIRFSQWVNRMTTVLTFRAPHPYESFDPLKIKKCASSLSQYMVWPLLSFLKQE